MGEVLLCVVRIRLACDNQTSERKGYWRNLDVITLSASCSMQFAQITFGKSLSSVLLLHCEKIMAIVLYLGIMVLETFLSLTVANKT